MKRLVTQQCSVLVVKTPKGDLRASPYQHGDPQKAIPLPPVVLWALGFNAAGKAEGPLRQASLREYTKIINEFCRTQHDLVIREIFRPRIFKKDKWLIVAVTAKLEEEIPDDEMFTFSTAFSSGHLVKHGASDFYQSKQVELTQALASGRPFDTDWHGCKHECLSVRVAYDGDASYTCQVSVTDDMDTEGIGTIERALNTPATLDDVAGWLNQAWTEAQEQQGENADYTGFSIHEGTADGAWVETYLAKRSDLALMYMDTPPGDNYQQWGFQDETDRIPAAVKSALGSYIEEHQFADEFLPCTVGGYTVTRWN